MDILHNNGVNADYVYVRNPTHLASLHFKNHPKPDLLTGPPHQLLSEASSGLEAAPSTSTLSCTSLTPALLLCLQVPSVPLYPSFFYRRSIIISKQQSAAIVSGLKAIGAITKEGWIKVDPRLVSPLLC